MDLSLWLQSKNYEVRGEKPSIISGVDRPNLAQWFKEWGFTKGVEVGTYCGEFASILCEANPEGHLTCVDPWASYAEYNEHVNRQDKMNRYYERAKQHLSKYNCTLIRDYSTNVAKQFPDGYFDYVYIDGNHTLPYVIADIYAWVPKIKKGGIISGHDYLWMDWLTGLQVVEAVDAYTKANRVNPWYVLGRKRKDTHDRHKLDKYARTWMWQIK